MATAYLRGRGAFRTPSLLLPSFRKIGSPPGLVERRVEGSSAERASLLQGEEKTERCRGIG